jgi:methylmalonyl-CoA/ethylmalonyl-CoA epimerase
MAKSEKSPNRLPPSVAAFMPDAKPRMPKKRRTGVNLRNMDQICIAVKDVDAAIEYYGSVFGLGPFYVMEYPSEMIYPGHPGKCRLKMAFALVGDIEIELIQVLEGETPHLEHLKQHGEGLFHIRFRVEDLDGALAELAQADVKPIWYDHLPGGVMAYLDSHKTCGVRFELVRSAESLSASKGQK